MTAGCSMAAMIFSLPPQCGQCSMSISKTRLSRRAQLVRATVAPVRSDGCGRRVLLRDAERSPARSLALGASTPWKRISASADAHQGGESAA